jgi:hypothetical protein
VARYVDDSIFDGKVTTERNHRSVKQELLEGMLSGMISVGQQDRPMASAQALNLRNSTGKRCCRLL